MTAQEYSIQELSEASGLPRRTIHFYTQQEILPPPIGAGLGAHYGEEHLLRLLLIPHFRRQGLRLDEIRVKFRSLSLEEMRQISTLASQAPPTRQPQPAGTPYTQYLFPAGIILAVPTNLGSTDRQKADQLLDSARRIFSSPDEFCSNTTKENQK